MHLRGDERKRLTIAGAFAERGHLVFAELADASRVLEALSQQDPKRVLDLRPSELFALGLLHEISHAITTFAARMQPRLFERAGELIAKELGAPVDEALLRSTEAFPPESVLSGKLTPEAFLASTPEDADGMTGREAVLEEQLLLEVARANPVFRRAAELFDDAALHEDETYVAFSKRILPAINAVDTFSDEGRAAHPSLLGAKDAALGHEGLVSWLTAPALAAPTSLESQLEYALVRFRHVIEPAGLWKRALYARSLLSDESRFFQRRNAAGVFEPLSAEEVLFAVGTGKPDGKVDDIVQYARDTNWMPNVVLLAKSTLVWLHQLSHRYGRPIERLSDIPDEELAEIARRGFTALWPIGLWKRSEASRKIKVLTGQADAAASAYAVQSYEIAEELGGEAALQDLRARAKRHGIRLACDLVPNHWGLDAEWVVSHPERFVQTDTIPFPGYRFDGPNLSSDARVSLFLEDGYWDRSDAAVVFKHVESATGKVRYLYHGNDGTTTPWNDTAQLDYLQHSVREAVTREIVSIAKRFPIIRFDAAMVLAKQHVRRLWYPAVHADGTAGDCIASRGAFAMSDEEFERAMPTEFWRDVANTVAQEAPDTLLLAEAFWMMEGYFVRSLGMHRVYNSAFMNMLRNEDNAGYRKVLRKVLDSDARVLERFVNFMNNPDELPAVVGFGDGNKYFGVCTLLATMPGLPMFGHGQFEGFSEKYGMEYRRALHAETPNPWLLARHDREIVPLLAERARFSGTDAFVLLDFVAPEGHVDEDVLAYANGRGVDRVVVVYNNVNRPASGKLVGLGPGGPAYDFFDGSLVTDDVATHAFELGGYGLRVLSGNPSGVASKVPAAAEAEAPVSSLRIGEEVSFSPDDDEAAKSVVQALSGLPADAPQLAALLLRLERGREVLAKLRTLGEEAHEPVVLAVSGLPLRAPSKDPLSLLLLAWVLSPLGGGLDYLIEQRVLDAQLSKIAKYTFRVPPDETSEDELLTWEKRVAHWLEEPEARALLGVHEALGRQWFHREAFHRMVACTIIRAAFDTPEGVTELLSVAKELREVAEGAGYEVPKLREALLMDTEQE
ncbi:MAG: alpha-amylase family glycosyl hydrolase [Polyangiaceae bacterium]